MGSETPWATEQRVAAPWVDNAMVVEYKATQPGLGSQAIPEEAVMARRQVEGASVGAAVVAREKGDTLAVAVSKAVGGQLLRG